MSEERIRTLHPAGKQGVHISRAKYDTIREAVLESMRQRGGEISFRDLLGAVEQKLAGRFEGAIGWYVESVKLDLEARGVIERLPDRRPQMLRLRAQ